MQRAKPMKLPKVPRSPRASSAHVSEVMRANRAKNTAPERELRHALRSIGVLGYRIAPGGIPGRPDVAFLSERLAVFVNGCFWHRCPKHHWKVPMSNSNYWRTKFQLNRERDARKSQELRDAGWKVIIIWECEIKKDAMQCATRVATALCRST